MEIKNINGVVLFADENLTTKKTLENAVKKVVNLSGVNLEHANLENANLGNSNLENANLRNADLRNANLENVDLRNADLRYANLRNADLRNADLQNADLRQANLEDANLENANLRNATKILIFCKWSHGITDGLIHIGCEKRSIEEWKVFLNSDERIVTERGTKDFKQIKAVICAYIAYLEILNK